jgi:hypothetical protein
LAAVALRQEDAVSEAFWKQESKPLGSVQSVDVKFEDCWALIGTANAREEIIKGCTLNSIFGAERCAQQILYPSAIAAEHPYYGNLVLSFLDQEVKSYLIVSLTGKLSRHLAK